MTVLWAAWYIGGLNGIWLQLLETEYCQGKKKTEKLRESFTDVAASCVTYVECDVLKSFVYSTERVAIGELNS